MKVIWVTVVMFATTTAHAESPKYSWLVEPIKMKPFKERAEGYVSEGFEVFDKDNKYTVVCKVSNKGIPSIIEWNGAKRIEEVDKKPEYYLRNARGFSELKLKWAETCRKTVN